MKAVVVFKTADYGLRVAAVLYAIATALFIVDWAIAYSTYLVDDTGFGVGVYSSRHYLLKKINSSLASDIGAGALIMFNVFGL